MPRYQVRLVRKAGFGSEPWTYNSSALPAPGEEIELKVDGGVVVRARITDVVGERRRGEKIDLIKATEL